MLQNIKTIYLNWSRAILKQHDKRLRHNFAVMSKKWIFYLAFAVLLVTAFYYFLFRGTDNWKKKLPIISYVKPFHFTTQDGLMYTDRDMLGKVCVVEYFFTTCKGICPKLNTNMKAVYEQFKNEPD